jgi:tetratricopeptide (TPR) repeat protein
VASAIRDSYYHPNGISGLDCNVSIDWQGIFTALNVQAPADSLAKLNGLKIQSKTTRGEAPEVTFDWSAGPLDSTADLEEALRQAVGSFYQMYWFFLASSPIGNAADITRIEPLPDGGARVYAVSQNVSVIITVDREWTPTRFAVNSPAMQGTIAPHYTGDPRRVSSMDLSEQIGVSTLNVELNVDYQALGKSYVPQQVSFNIEGHKIMIMNFTSCSATTGVIARQPPHTGAEPQEVLATTAQQWSTPATETGKIDSSWLGKLQSRDLLNQGVEAYKKEHYQEAIALFTKSTELDTSNLMARLYLGTAYAQLVVPEDLSTKNLQIAQSAIDSFQIVLLKNPADVNTLKQIASVYYSIQKFDQARDYQNQVLARNPKDAEAEYTIGVIDWQLSYKNAVGILAGAGLKDDGMGNTAKDNVTCMKLREVNAALVDDGIMHLGRAVDLQSDYSDAMAYLNLTYRRKADLECGDDSSRKHDVDEAEAWRTRAVSSRGKSDINGTPKL